MNMGVVARHLYDRYICPFSTGIFQIDYAPSDGAAWNAHTAMAETYPLEMDQGRICSGYLPLVPVYKKSKYRAWILVSESVHCVIGNGSRYSVSYTKSFTFAPLYFHFRNGQWP